MLADIPAPAPPRPANAVTAAPKRAWRGALVAVAVAVAVAAGLGLLFAAITALP